MPPPGGWLVVWGCGGSRRCFPSGTREVCPIGKTLPTIRRKEDLVGLTPAAASDGHRIQLGSDECCGSCRECSGGMSGKPAGCGRFSGGVM